MSDYRNVLTDEEKAEYREAVAESSKAADAFAVLLESEIARTGLVDLRYADFRKEDADGVSPQLRAAYNEECEARNVVANRYADLCRAAIRRSPQLATVQATANFWLNACRGSVLGTSGDGMVDAMHALAAGSAKASVDEAAATTAFGAYFKRAFDPAHYTGHTVRFSVDYGPEYPLYELLAGCSMQYLPLKSGTATTPLEFKTKIGYGAEHKTVISLLD